MKKLPLFVFLAAFSVNAQNKLTSKVVHYYSDAVTLDGIDSIVYNYAWDWGVINSHQPKFSVFKDAPVYLWNYEEPTLDYTTREFWGNSNYPLSQYWLTTKTYNMNNLCTSDEGTGYRDLYTYTASGMIETHTVENETMPGVWEIIEKMDFFYDGMDRLVAVHQYDGTQGFYTNKDSLWYDASTTNIVMNRAYRSDDGITFNLKEQAETYWTGGHPDYADYSEDVDNDPMTPIEWVMRANYTFPGAWCTKVEVHTVMMGTPQAMVVAQWDYTYNGSGQLVSDIRAGAFENGRIDYTYQADGLLETIDFQDDPGTGLYTVEFTEFHYTDVAGIEENTIELTVYPNPAVNVVNLPGTFEHVRVVDMNGNLVIAQMNCATIEVSSLNAGQYVIYTSNAGESATASFVKQ